MGNIHILNESVSNKIAAGEVVERPASVVKELAENSIDAGASSITVEIRDGGISYTRVTDNGTGMDEDDAKNSFVRHATSKISGVRDLANIITLGFRGEALASIGSVSETEMITKPRGNTYGTRVVIKGGEMLSSESTGCADGTSITVKNLFYNTPARLKFLKKESRESAAVSEVMYNLALSKPGIGFKFINNGKNVFATPGDGDLKNTILTLYGMDIYNSLIGVSYNGNILSINGYIGKPEISRSNRNYQFFFVNGRCIKNRMLSVAVDNAYKTLLMINKFAFCILSIDIVPELVDVNVHPAKAEVRFQDEKEIFSAIFNTVRNGLSGQVLIPEAKHGVSAERTEQLGVLDGMPSKVPQTVKEDRSSWFTKRGEDGQNREYGAEPPSGDALPDSAAEESSESVRAHGKNILPPLVVIGQCHFTYILCQGPDGLYIIDQHAAHERIMYERYRDSFERQGIVSQSLMVPMVVEVSPEEVSTVKEHFDAIKKLGFDFEFFGNNSVMLRAVPLVFGKPVLKKFFIEIIDDFDEGASSGRNSVDSALYTMACRSAVKANDRLDMKEMESIIDGLRGTSNPYTCPHGRPTIIKISNEELERKFKRIP